ncbi:hypothetical protein AO896_30095 [Pseudomonas aeruginosa]|nr:hypothetical protein BH596_01375 [Pseudomonas aeruginosa]OPD67055.1 hypothetical protein AO882_32765 [Pseudomonas paraeruginosa]OPD69875.1 hypothetical protein AO898_30460 [Pseudomonas aeruginosa]OPD70455.1 hypothetical protein AO896_30095 [Pseudomonas aeruginosa]OPD86468.1 hypothetical protein AO955_31925 [Pseudomonas aeruginosa]
MRGGARLRSPSVAVKAAVRQLIEEPVRSDVPAIVGVSAATLASASTTAGRRGRFPLANPTGLD